MRRADYSISEPLPPEPDNGPNTKCYVCGSQKRLFPFLLKVKRNPVSVSYTYEAGNERQRLAGINQAIRKQYELSSEGSVRGCICEHCINQERRSSWRALGVGFLIIIGLAVMGIFSNGDSRVYLLGLAGFIGMVVLIFSAVAAFGTNATGPARRQFSKLYGTAFTIIDWESLSKR